MRRRELSEDELNKVIRLRQTGASWLKIQRETGIHRQIAKRAYERWEYSKSMAELKEARRDVAAQAFREHVDALVTLAASLVTNLSAPSSLDAVEISSEDFLLRLWDSDLLGRSQSPKGIMDHKSYRREQQLLFEALKVHTREAVPWREELDRWRNAWDRCREIVDKLRKETAEEVEGFIKQEQERKRDFLQKIKQQKVEQKSGEKDPQKQMAEMILKSLWSASVGREEKETSFEMGSGDNKTFVLSTTGQGRVLTFLDGTNTSLAEKVTKICNSAASNLRKGDTVQDLRSEIGDMKKVTDKLREALNPVKLRPMILRTRCDICPA